jgi:uncharacterized protein with HEPN domain
MKDDMVYVGHMLDTALKARAFIENKTRADFDNDEPLRLALTHLLQTIGEAGRRVSQPFRDSHPEIAWKQIVGMRMKIVHDYFDVNEDAVWDTVNHDLPSLIAQLETIVPPEEK